MSSLGVAPVTDWDDEHPPVEYGGPEEGTDEVQRFKDDLIEYIEGWGP